MVLEEPLVSGHHAELRRTSSGWQLADLSSSNGTFVNGCPASWATLMPGDVIGLGQRNSRVDGQWLLEC